MKRRWKLIIGILILIIGVAGFTRSKKDNITKVTTATVVRDSFTREASGTGSVEGRIYTLSFPQTSGRIEKIFVKEGDQVQAGTVLAELATEKIHEEINSCLEEIRSNDVALQTQEIKSDTDLQKLINDARETQRKVELTRKLVSIGAESAEELRTQERKLREILADQRSNQAGTRNEKQDLIVKKADCMAKLQGYKQDLRESQLIAPVSGTVSQIDFRMGEEAQGSLKLVETGSLRVKAQISEAESGQISQGQPARIELDAAPDRPLPAEVVKLGVVATIKGEGGSATLPVTLQFRTSNAVQLARPGYTVTAKISTLKLGSVLQVPLETLVEEDRNGITETYLWVINPKTQTISKRQITVLAKNLTRAAIEGVSAGTKVISLPPDTLKNGQKIQEDKGEAK